MFYQESKARITVKDWARCQEHVIRNVEEVFWESDGLSASEVKRQPHLHVFLSLIKLYRLNRFANFLKNNGTIMMYLLPAVVTIN